MGNLFIAGYASCRIHRMDYVSKKISTIAGSGECTSSGDGREARIATVNYPIAVAVDADENIYFSDSSPSCVRRIDAKTRLIRSIPVTCDVKLGSAPSGLAVDRQGNLYFALWASNMVRRVDALTGTVTTEAGSGLPKRTDYHE